MNSGSSSSCNSSGRVLAEVFCLSVLNMLIKLNVYKEAHCLLQTDHEGLGLMDWP